MISLLFFSSMSVRILDEIRTRAAQLPQRVVFTRPEAEGVLEAVDAIRRSKIAVPILVGQPDSISNTARGRGLTLSGISIEEPVAGLDRYVDLCLSGWRAQGIGETETRTRLLDPEEFGVAMIRARDGDAVISGPASSGGSGIPTVVLTAGAAPGCSLLSNSFLVIFSDDRPPVTVSEPPAAGEPSSAQLAEGALAGARTTRLLLGRNPHVAILTLAVIASLQPRNRFRSASDTRREKVYKAAQTVRARDETVVIDSRGRTSLNTDADGPNTFVFAERQSGNLRHRLEQEFPGARVVGPIVQGVDLPVNQLSAGMSVDEIIDIVAMTAVLAADQNPSK